MTVYRAALAKHHQAQRDQNVNSRLLCRSSGEKYAAKIAKTSTYFCSRNDGSVSFQIGHSISGFLRERSVSALVQINRLKEIQSLRPYTTSIGLRSSYRVEDDPIIKYTADARPGGSNVESTDDEAVKKYGLDIGKVADEEVVEYILRLVVGRLGASEQVFHALKTELGFAQAYTAYSELKKLHDSRERAGARIAKVRKLIQEEGSTGDPSIAALSNLMEHASLSIDSVRTRGGRLQPPISTFESNIVDSVVDSAIVGMAALGLRATDSYNELVDVYRGTFCRMCYQYGCHEHGGEHSLPTRRVDPTYPRVQSVPVAALGGIDDDEDSASDSSDDDTVCLSSDASDEGKSPPEIRSVRVAATRPAPQRLRDPSEFVNASHVSLVATKMRTFLSGGAVCSEKCWKRGRSSGSNRGKASLSPTEVGIVRKLRETMGDNSCLLAAVVGSASCETLHEFVEEEEITSSERPNRRLGNWKHGRRSGGSNHELVQRMRNQRLQDRGTTNHEYKPCMHEGMCDSTGCSCMKRDHMCEKACACSRDCPNRFEGCTCAPGSCRTDACPCFAALRECDPDFCLSCGASNVAVSLLSGAISSPRMIEQCGNVNVACTRHKRLMKSFSDIHGYGMYAHEPIAANEFVYEYTGAMLSQDEAERRGMLYDKMNMSYLFDLNEDAVLDALRSGNKSKFINHEGETPNCTAKVVSVCGIHHISIWALRDIAKGEELVFDYGYKGNVGPEWSKRRSRLETVVSKDPK
ncbi:Histone-lysine N-methyltransferase ezh1 [Phytophthora boehmeriae]|uniref:Histone-lysine N-methyltransferase ezh1 n=1 Tax=Phytophthora boehmeriae TaxID=109152 RepID=A0A8T1XC73_9STRA|nr:Histone-lysine N-methyltransferase ezh1 [Phytophthora boehmeriae]